MFMSDKQSFDFWSGPSREIFEFWISFSPAAPFFGVEWRFADTMAEVTKTTETVAMAAEKSVETVAEAAVEVAEEVVASVPAAVEPEVVETFEEAAAESVADALDTVEEEFAAPAGLMTEAPAVVDDLTTLNGVGPALAKKLNALGVYTFKQIAGFTQDDLTWVDENLGGIKGRCFRDNWVGQAKTRLS